MASSLDHIFLPFELTEEILSAIPIEYLIRFHLICKEWYSLFKNKRFIYKYLDLTQERFIRIDNMVQIIDPVTQTRINSLLPAEFPYRPLISTMLHCDGLVLLKFNNREIGPRTLLIWNPILGQIKWIQIQPKRNRYWYRRSYRTNWDAHYMENRTVCMEYNDETYGIGYDNASRDDHKILRFYYRKDLNKRYGDEIEIEIYDLKSNSWRFLEGFTSDWLLVLSSKGVSVIGNMYWVAQRRTDSQIFIQSFDFSTGTFKPTSYLPFPFENHKHDILALSSFRTDKLSLLHQCAITEKIEIWVTNKVDNEGMSWNKYLSVANPNLPLLYAHQNLANPGFFIDKNDKIRVWYEKGIGERENGEEDVSVSVYEISKDGFKEEFERSRSNSYGDYDTPFLSGYVYVPSLVPLRPSHVKGPRLKKKIFRF